MPVGLKKWRRKKPDIDQETCAAYVLITCAKPNAKGEMQVEMTYEGDEALASYLVKSAGNMFAHESME